MKFTNRTGIKSRSLRKALESNAGYDLNKKPDNLYSLTQVIGPPKASILFDRHKDELKIDYVDRLWLMTGSAKHYYLELATKEDDSFLTEYRWYYDIKKNLLIHFEEHSSSKEILDLIEKMKPNVIVSGKLDCFDKEDGIIEDYKETKKGSIIFSPGGKDDWKKQINIHAYALRKMGYTVNGGRIVAILRNWEVRDLNSRNKALLQSPIAEPDIALWTDSQCEEYIQERINLFESVKHLPDDEIPICSKEERWNENRCDGNGFDIWCPQRGFCNYYREKMGQEEQ